MNAIIGKIRESRRGPYYPHLYVVKEDGEPSLRIWALSLLVEDRQDARPSYHQYINALKDKVSLACLPLPFLFVPPFFLSLIFLIPSLFCLAHHTG